MTHLHYRVWDGEQMYYSGDEGLCISIGEMMPNKVFGWSLWLDGYGVIAHSGDENHILMWGTGVKDKNSRPIYERDITKFPNGEFNKVILNRGRFLMKINGVFGKELDSTCEVIGNVYQNPDLLEAAE
ncbi:YopX family protein [Bacillus paralicheniformis]|uniref:YopX family protein n=1 Tax=Bacillus paralicheniformis TaxID=1648923 RepID=UPI0021A4564A|nr:YopX family protein [Bacillus paralicheniformis]UWS63400.1 YopX family protein [Bacillus paralicheniformis]